jgi:hypothetical protein
VASLFADLIPAAMVEEFVKYALAVVGGYIAGNIATLILCRVIARYGAKERMGVPLERALRTIGGFIVAIIVALFLFPGGWGRGGPGTGQGEGSGGETSGKDKQANDKQPPAKVDEKRKDDAATLASGLKVTILRGKDYPKSYLFEGESEGIDFAAAKEKLRQRLEASEGRLKFVDVLIYKNSTAEKSALIEDLETFAHDLGLRTSRKKLDQSLPD